MSAVPLCVGLGLVVASTLGNTRAVTHHVYTWRSDIAGDHECHTRQFRFFAGGRIHGGKQVREGLERKGYGPPCARREKLLLLLYRSPDIMTYSSISCVREPAAQMEQSRAAVAAYLAVHL